MDAEELKCNFRRRYLLAILLIAIFPTIAFFILHLALKFNDSTELLINISGKQRMLSQRIASQSQQYYGYLSSKKALKNSNGIESALYASIREMGDANERLSSGKLDNETTIEVSKGVYSVYFGEQHLKNRVDTYLALGDDLLHARTKQEAKRLLQELIYTSDKLLPDLDLAVAQYQHERDEYLLILYNFGLIVWLLTLFMLLFEVIFIFQPMANKIRELFQKVVWNRQNLLQEIDIRTFNLQQANEKLAHLASHDPLTGLKNRLNLEEELESLINHYKIHHLPYAVVMLDIDWFKKINDTYGHDAGDFVLCELAKIFSENVRSQDSVYRAGGEEFVIIFNRITKDKVLDKCEKIRQKIQDHLFVYNEESFKVTISSGVYHTDIVEVETIQEGLKLADNALYEAKRTGRNKVVLAHEDSMLLN
ncbi:MAG: diguanylate cyclase [Sulfuricurvum sp.]